ncbi:MAG: transcriptional regulator NrdR [Alphaproteobacteria bacterium]|nr:MAG: transcriptional regulator NrdR [Alphaproteobacteria bacterium]
MHCPFCSAGDTQVKDSRQAEEGGSIRRRRSCVQCGGRFTTFERTQLRELTVIKNNGDKELFDRDKLYRSMKTPLRKRPIDNATLENVVNGIVRQMESLGEAEIPTGKIGEFVMQAFMELDHVAYIRYASVYKDFREVADFNEFVDDLQKVQKKAS